MRSLLTMMGIIIGIGSVILMISVGKGAESLILASVQSFGSRSIFIQPGAGSSGGPPSIYAVDKVKYKDFLAVQKLDYVEDVTPFVILNTFATYLSENQKVNVVGTNHSYPNAIDGEVSHGRFLSVDDIANGARVVVIGYKNAALLFGDQEPLGKRIKINGKSFEVIGVMDEQGTRFFQDFDKRMLIPITTMRNTLFGGDYVMTILMNAKGDIPETIEELRTFVRKRHSIYNPDNDPTKDDFKVISQVDAAAMFTEISEALTLFLVAIAAISLLVGGIGIMNIMLVAVSERTREIGLRKAVGASNSDIMSQFLIESAVLTFIAGVLGVIGGLSMSWLIAVVLENFQPDWEFIVSWESVVLAFTVSVMIGLVFGIYPARNASKMDPIVCLRME
jgi:putative ABC transport system permease protein